MKRYFALVLMALFAAASAALAQGPDDQYVRIYNIIQEADALTSSGQNSQAVAKYMEAQSALQRFQRGFPDWNVKVVSFRVNYVAAKIAALAPNAIVPPAASPAPTPLPNRSVTTPGPSPAVKAPGPTAPAPAPGAPSLAEFQEQLNALRDQVRQLQVDKTSLENKLKEAFAAQPPPTDPRELSNAQEKMKVLEKENQSLKTMLSQQSNKPGTIDPIELSKAQEKAKSLQAENDSLKTALTQERSKPAADPKVLSQTQAALAEANRKLTEQTEKAKTLAEEKQFLQSKLSVLAATEQNATVLEETKKALADAKRQLAEQRELGARLTLEKEALQSRFRSMADAETVSALRAENQLLKQQLASASKTATPDATAKLSQAQAQIAVLQSDKEQLLLEKRALQNRLNQIASSPALATASPAPSPNPAVNKAEESARIKELEHERDDLQKKLEAAVKGFNGRKSQAVAARMDEMENQLGTLRARLAVFETRAVPYTKEELALFKNPEPRMADPKAGKKSVKELPAGTEKFVAEAQRYYSNNQLDKAEESYLKALQADKKNVPLLANLANIQLDRNNLTAAENNIKQAIALAPDDAYSQLVLGRLRLHQERFDDAIDALSRAAKLDPQDAQIQNFLGLALNEKGLRGPAETALRKAIQLDPGYPNAHNNLAVMYLTQQPPLVELARWHYQKALSGGFPRNPDLERMIEGRKPIE